MSDMLNNPLGDESDLPKPKGLSRPGGWLGDSFVGLFVSLAFLVAASIFVGIVTTTAKVYVAKPKWLRNFELPRIPKRREINYIYTPEIMMTGRTNDPVSYVYDISLSFGFPESNRTADPEIARRGLEIQDLLRSFFSIRSAKDLNPINEEKLKTELLKKMNDFLKTGKVEEVLFLRLDVS